MHRFHSSLMNDACYIAKKSSLKHSHGCIIVDRKGKKMTIHAEEMALKNADPRKLRGARLYVVRNNGDNLLNSMPCERCMSIINFCMNKHGLKVVYYSR
jgi:cytidine deaminase